tara:strand:+ start:70 stop:486 length:417 start_codon:yes stop_codon:yes gene_type:complete
MKYITILFLFLYSSSYKSQCHNLDITIKNIKNLNGYIQIGLYNIPKEFPKSGREYKSYYFKVTSKTMKYTIKCIPNGNYAVATYHDENSDKKCNRNLIGYPTEDYGFSNNVKVFIASPSFKDALIELNKDKAIEISID